MKSIEKQIWKKTGIQVECTEYHGSIKMAGESNDWQMIVKAGAEAAKLKQFREVINDINYLGENLYKKKKKPTKTEESFETDVLIIGAGVIGCSIARELSKWNLQVMVVDKEEDVSMHQSSRNDGMVHPGFAAKSGSKKAHYNVLGNQLYPEICRQLQVPIEATGSFIVFSDKRARFLKAILDKRARANKVEDTDFLPREALLKYEPYLADDIVYGYKMGTTKVISPYRTTIAFAENAIQNGVTFLLKAEVLDIEHKDKVTAVETTRGIIKPRLLINAAGLFSDEISKMAGDGFFTIHPRKGEIAILDKKYGEYLNTIIGKIDLKLSVLKSNTKGGGAVKTVEGNILLGPNSIEQPNKEDYSTNHETVEAMIKAKLEVVKGLYPSQVITYLAGNRAATYKEDFIIETSPWISNLITVAGIQSPGLASAPAIALDVEKMVLQYFKGKLKENIVAKEHWNPNRIAPPDLQRLSFEERQNTILKNPNYGHIICRCEQISKGEIIDAIKSPIPVMTLDGIKRRTRAGMGRCQGGFCTPQILKIIEETAALKPIDITKKGIGSNIIVGYTKEENNEI